MPRKMQELLQLKDAAKNRKRVKKDKSKVNQPALLCVKTAVEGDDEGHTRGLKFIPSVIQQGPYESEFAFMKRLDRMAAKARSEALVEDKFDVDYCPQAATPKFKPKILSTKTGKEVKYTSKGKIHLDDAETKRSRKAEKRKERAAKLKERKKKKLKKDKKEDFDSWIDQFEFNDVVQEPPAFSKKRKAKLLKLSD